MPIKYANRNTMIICTAAMTNMKSVGDPNDCQGNRDSTSSSCAFLVRLRIGWPESGEGVNKVAVGTKCTIWWWTRYGRCQRVMTLASELINRLSPPITPPRLVHRGTCSYSRNSWRYPIRCPRIWSVSVGVVDTSGRGNITPDCE